MKYFIISLLVFVLLIFAANKLRNAYQKISGSVLFSEVRR
jgi:hypothetical protein